MLLVLVPARTPGDVGPMLSVDDVVRGMKGIGRTVFQGTRIDTFSVEILGVLRNVYGPGRSLILARLSGGPLEETGVIAGMSGSPVFVDGKLIGAVAYNWAFSKQPIAGITPIGEMLEVLARPSSPAGTSGWTGTRAGWASGAFADASVSSHLEEPGPFSSYEVLSEMRPVAVPLVASGFSPRVLAELRQTLQAYGLFPVQGGGGTDESLPKGPFEPGAALGVQLIRGDYSMTGIGTLTYRDGDRVVGFGHPMFWSGSTAMPMTAAYIHEVIPSQMLSFKLGAASEPIGMILQDRASGIAGVVGQYPVMVPMTIEVSTESSDTSPEAGSKTFRMEVLRNRDLGPLLMRAAVTNSLMSAEKVMGETTVRMRSRIVLAGHSNLEVENVYSGPVGIGQAALGATEPIRHLVQNRFEAVDVESVSIKLEVEERTRTARIDAIRLGRSLYEPGDTAHVEIVLKPYLGTPEVRTASVVIPESVRSGRLILRVSAGAAYRSSERKRSPGKFEARDVEHLIEILGRTERNDTMMLELLSQSPGLAVEGREMGTLPPSVQAALRQSRVSGAVRRVAQSVMDRQRISTDYVLSGSQTVYLTVGKEGGLIFDGKGRSGEEKPQRP